jgi:hypothetical protein
LLLYEKTQKRQGGAVAGTAFFDADYLDFAPFDDLPFPIYFGYGLWEGFF